MPGGITPAVHRTPLFRASNHWRRYRGARAYRISLINVHTEALAVILPGVSPRPGPGLDHPVARFLYRDLSPMRGMRVIPRWPTPKLRYYRSTSTGNTIERSYLAIEKIEASLINRTGNDEIESIVRMDDFSECEREKHLGNLAAASCPARVTPWCSPNGALTWRPHESKRCSTGTA